MTDAQMKKREEIIKGMKGKISEFKKNMANVVTKLCMRLQQNSPCKKIINYLSGRKSHK
jgi:hypothetical protein